MKYNTILTVVNSALRIIMFSWWRIGSISSVFRNIRYPLFRSLDLFLLESDVPI